MLPESASLWVLLCCVSVSFCVFVLGSLIVICVCMLLLCAGKCLLRGACVQFVCVCSANCAPWLFVCVLGSCVQAVAVQGICLSPACVSGASPHKAPGFISFIFLPTFSTPRQPPPLSSLKIRFSPFSSGFPLFNSGLVRAGSLSEQTACTL